MTADPAITEILYDAAAIQERVRAMAQTLQTRCRSMNSTPVFLIVLSGAFIFAADLLRHLDLPLELAFVRCSSYGGKTTSSGQVSITFEEPVGLEGKDVFILEDIVDTGRTLTALKERLLHKEKAQSVAIAAFLDKPSRREVEIAPDFVGFTIPDRFVVGYGLDYAGRYRNLPDLAVLAPEKP